MIKILNFVILFFGIVITQSALANIPTMTLNWTLPDTSESSQFKLYYSLNADMSVKTWHENCTVPSALTQGAFSMTCTNIPITSFPVYIQIIGTLADTSEIGSNIQIIESDPIKTDLTTIPVVQNFRLTSPLESAHPNTLFYWNIDSLPETTITSDIGNITITKTQNDGTSSPGIVGNCLEQTGISQSYYFPMTIVPINKGTISFWAKHSTPSDSTDGTTRFFFKSTNIGKASTIYAYTYKNAIYFIIYDSSGSLHRTFKVADTWTKDVWYEYEFSWNGEDGSMSIRRDKAIVSEIDTTPWHLAPPFWGTQDLHIGNRAPLGSFDEFYISTN
ncbi:MAG: hypothetical protein COA36_08900 [Desulfotalea sp.]|nr:MAG: hypothetical protein COA36_08900 [Desulfotalea sp.]